MAKRHDMLLLRQASPQPIARSQEATMTHPDFRALLDEVADMAEKHVSPYLGHEKAWGEFLDRIDAALAAPQQGAKGLHGKYIIHRSADGSPVEFPCFVLRVDGADDAAMVAVRAYAAHPDCPPELAADLAEHVNRSASFAALAAPQQGAPSDEELLQAYLWACSADMKRQGGLTASDPNGIAKQLEAQTVAGLRAVLARYGAQAVPVAPSNICTGCNTPRHEAIAAIANGAIANGAMACCPDCSTLTVEDRNAIRAAQAVPVAVADVRYEFSIYDGKDEWQAGGDAPTLKQATQEGQRYLAHYPGDDGGPYRLELRRVKVLSLP